MFSGAVVDFWAIVMGSEFSGYIGDFALGLVCIAGGQEYGDVVVRGQAVGLAGDAAAAAGISGGDGRQQREVVGLGQPSAAAGYTAVRHLTHSSIIQQLNFSKLCYISQPKMD